jgi:RNA-directed DNA polymerase
MEYNIFCSYDNLKKAWGALKKNPRSYGVDKQTMSNFNKNHELALKKISNELTATNFKFSPTRGVTIPKNGQKNSVDRRPLAINTIEDRVVLKALAMFICSKYSGKINTNRDVSFAYQKGKSIWDALNKIKEHYNNGYYWVVEADIKDFFGSINQKLIELAFRRKEANISKEFVDLIVDCLKQAINLENVPPQYHYLFMQKDTTNPSGIPQGNPISPIVSNLYLQTFDNAIKSKDYKLVRYADDFVILCKTEEDAKSAFELAKEKLAKLYLELYPLDDTKKPSKIIHLSTDNPIVFLSIGFDGSNTYPSQKAIDNLKKQLKAYFENKELSVLDLLNKVNNTLKGWFGAYKSASCIEKIPFFTEVDELIDKQLYISLSKKNWQLLLRKEAKETQKLTKAHRKESGIGLCKDIWENLSK